MLEMISVQGRAPLSFEYESQWCSTIWDCKAEENDAQARFFEAQRDLGFVGSVAIIRNEFLCSHSWGIMRDWVDIVDPDYAEDEVIYKIGIGILQRPLEFETLNFPIPRVGITEASIVGCLKDGLPWMTIPEGPNALVDAKSVEEPAVGHVLLPDLDSVLGFRTDGRVEFWHTSPIKGACFKHWRNTIMCEISTENSVYYLVKLISPTC